MMTFHLDKYKIIEKKYTKGYLGSLKYLELKIYDLGRGLGSLISGPINELLGMRNTIRLFGITCKYYYLLCDLDTISLIYILIKKKICLLV